jgi:hypothetical protein
MVPAVINLASAKPATGVAHKRKSNSVVERSAMPAAGSFLRSEGVYVGSPNHFRMRNLSFKRGGKMISKLKLKLICTVFLILFTQAAALAYAQGGLNLIAVTLVGGGNVQDAADIPTEPQFKVQFDKNVVNSSIWEANSKCFSLISQNNQSIPVTVTKVDDANDFAQRQNIFVQPVNPLSPGTSYYLKISPELKAKNGATLGGSNSQEVAIAFKTKGDAPNTPSSKDNQ